jgi:BirA family biotin operon repressor/biotin-[acetyl-CoA-carboxylase] ligase
MQLVAQSLAAAGVSWPAPTWLETTGSTNQDVLAAATAGAPEGTIIGADEQTAGRGRLNRTWRSAPGAGVWMSILIRPTGTDHLNLLPVVAGLASVDALGRPVQLKWPNDLVVDRPEGLGKVGGILVEVDGSAAAVGIGINRSSVPLPGAIGLDDISPNPMSRSEIVIGIAQAMFTRLEQWRSSPSALIDDYRHRCITLGRPVVVHFPDGEELRGSAADVTEDGHLVVTTDSETRIVTTADVVHATI